ncbi:MAG: hypothetical protein CMM61_15515 [Rhodospirillaceae bacterium]|nr:hypothetical protein [Rhodospirillaceae bacterium]
MRFRWFLAGLTAAFLGVAPGGAWALDVDLELVLAVDVSGSIEKDEAELQRQGFVQAFRNEAVVRAVTSGKHRRIAVTYVEWAGTGHQRMGVDWRVIDGAAAADAFADELLHLPFASALWTSISGAIDFGMGRLAASPHRSDRQVIDISGDGANNHGELVVPARDRAVRQGVTINGLPIVNGRPSPYGTPQIPNLDWYFEDCVIGGPGAFIVVADGFADFGRAIKRKLIREIAGLSGPRIESADVDFPRLAKARAGRAGSAFGQVRAVRMEQRPSCEAGEDMLKNMDDT